MESHTFPSFFRPESGIRPDRNETNRGMQCARLLIANHVVEKRGRRNSRKRKEKKRNERKRGREGQRRIGNKLSAFLLPHPFHVIPPVQTKKKIQVRNRETSSYSPYICRSSDPDYGTYSTSSAPLRGMEFRFPSLHLTSQSHPTGPPII